MDENVMMDDPFDPDQYGVQSAPGMPNEYTNVPRRPLSKEMQEQLNQSMTVPPPVPPIRVFGGYGQEEGYRRPSQGERYLGASGPIQIRGYAESPQSQEDQARYEGQFGLALQDRMQHINQVVQQAVNNPLMYHTDHLGRRQPSPRLQEILRQSYSAMGELGQFHQRGGPGGKSFLEPQTQFSTPQMNQLAQLDKAEADWQGKLRSGEINQDMYDEVSHQLDTARQQIRAKAIPQGPSPQEKLNMALQYHAASKKWYRYVPKTDSWEPDKEDKAADDLKHVLDYAKTFGVTMPEAAAAVREARMALSGQPQGQPGAPQGPPGMPPGAAPGVPAQPPGQPAQLPLGPPMPRKQWQDAYHVVVKGIDDIVAEDHKEKHRKRVEGKPAYEPRINPDQVDWAKIQALEDAGLIPPGNRGAQLEGAPRRTGYEHYLEMHKRRATPPGAPPVGPGWVPPQGQPQPGQAPPGAPNPAVVAQQQARMAKVIRQASEAKDPEGEHAALNLHLWMKDYPDITKMPKELRARAIEFLKRAKKYDPTIEVPDL